MTKTEILEKRIEKVENDIDCDTHTEAINNLKMDMINIKNVTIPSFKKEVTEMIKESIKAMGLQVEGVQNKINKFMWTLIVSGVVLPFTILLVNRYLPKLLDLLKL